jgi:mono/diheme cytochrome c family protein
MRRAVLLLAFVALLGAAVAGCGGEEEESATPETVQGSLPEQTDTGDGGGASVEGDAAAGEAVYASAGCGGCHTLEAAGSTGTVGPNLDESQPDFELAVDRVTNGQGAMPAFEGQLSEQQIADVAAYVAESTG